MSKFRVLATELVSVASVKTKQNKAKQEFWKGTNVEENFPEYDLLGVVVCSLM